MKQFNDTYNINEGNGYDYIRNDYASKSDLDDIKEVVDEINVKMYEILNPDIKKLRKEKIEEIFSDEKNIIGEGMLDYLKGEIQKVSDTTFGVRTNPTGCLEHLKGEIDELLESLENDDKESSAEKEEWADCMLLLLDAFRIRYGNDTSFNRLLHFCLNKLDTIEDMDWDRTPDEKGMFHRKK